MNGYSYASELIPQIGQIYSLSINNKISLFMIAAPIVDFISKRDAFIVKVTPAIYSEPPYDLQSVIHDNFPYSLLYFDSAYKFHSHFRLLYKSTKEEMIHFKRPEYVISGYWKRGYGLASETIPPNWRIARIEYNNVFAKILPTHEIGRVFPNIDPERCVYGACAEHDNFITRVRHADRLMFYGINSLAIILKEWNKQVMDIWSRSYEERMKMCHSEEDIDGVQVMFASEIRAMRRSNRSVLADNVVGKNNNSRVLAKPEIKMQNLREESRCIVRLIRSKLHDKSCIDMIRYALTNLLSSISRKRMIHSNLIAALTTFIDQINTINSSYNGCIIETEESEQLCEFLDNVASYVGFDETSFIDTKREW